MPRVVFKGKEITCSSGDNLRRVLIQHGETPHNGKSDMVNCHGLGTCGTCAVEISGTVHPMNITEKVRLSVAPHTFEHGLRLACCVVVEHDISVVKHDGFWGQDIDSQQSEKL